MRILASKFIYPQDEKNLAEVLRPFRNLAIQLAFFQRRSFLQMSHGSIKEICNSLNIEIPTVHAPTVDVFDKEFLKVIETIKENYNVKLISIHPQKGDAASALAKLDEYSGVLEDLGVILAYENFPSSAAKRKWICLPSHMYSIFNLPFLKLTFDTSHLDSPSDCIEEFKMVCDKVAVIHLSDNDKRSRHLPLGMGCLAHQQFLEHLKACNFGGPVVLEYMYEYERRLIEDAHRLSDTLQPLHSRRFPC